MAKDYLEKKEELEKFEVALTVYEIEELHMTMGKAYRRHSKSMERKN